MQQQVETGALPVIRTIGFFGVNKFDAEPIVAPAELKSLQREIYWPKVVRINNGEPLAVGNNYVDFPPKGADLAKVGILKNTERLERAVAHYKPDAKGKVKVFARAIILCDLVKAILYPNKQGYPKEFKFSFDEGKKELKISAIDLAKYKKTIGFGPFFVRTITTERETKAKDKVYIGHQGVYQLTEFSYPQFVVYSSKMIEAFEKVRNKGKTEEISPVEIKSCANLETFRMEDILRKNVAFANVNKLIVGEVESQGGTTLIKQVRVIEKVEIMDSSNLVQACRLELGKILAAILELVKRRTNGILSINHLGIRLFDVFERLQDGRNFIPKTVDYRRFDPKNGGEPLDHKTRRTFYNKSSVQYLVDPRFNFKTTWPCRDQQDLQAFLDSGFSNRKKQDFVLLFSNVPQNLLKVRSKLEEEGYFYDKMKSDWLQNEYSENLVCYVLEKSMDNVESCRDVSTGHVV